MQETNPFAHLGLYLPSRSSRSSLTRSQFQRFQFYYPILGPKCDLGCCVKRHKIDIFFLVQLLLMMIIMDENGKPARVCETGAFSSRLTTGEVNALKEEVTIRKGQLAAEGEQMSIIVWASQMFCLQIPMPALDLAPPSTSQFLCPTDTQ
ncbi:unnamed protein product [Malus baccata var. baccata]